MDQYGGYLVLALCLGMLAFIIVWWIKKTPKEESSGQIKDRLFERETRLFRMYENMEDLMDSFEGFVEGEKREILLVKEEMLRLRQREAVFAAQAQTEPVQTEVLQEAQENITLEVMERTQKAAVQGVAPVLSMPARSAAQAYKSTNTAGREPEEAESADSQQQDKVKPLEVVRPPRDTIVPRFHEETIARVNVVDTSRLPRIQKPNWVVLTSAEANAANERRKPHTAVETLVPATVNEQHKEKPTPEPEAIHPPVSGAEARRQERTRDILRLRETGMRNDQIAHELNLTISEVSLILEMNSRFGMH